MATVINQYHCRWYNVDFSMAEDHAWGRLSGCRFAHGSCGEWIRTREARSVHNLRNFYVSYRVCHFNEEK